MTRELDAADQPCAIRRSHNPVPVRTQSHHRFPEYLQRRLWGVVKLEDRWPLCGTDHDSVHTWISVLLGEQAQPTLDPGLLVKAEAVSIVTWYNGELAKIRAYGDGPYGEGEYAPGTGADRGAEWDGVE